MLYEVSVKEILERIVTIEAANEEEAIDIVEEKYKEEVIVLDSNDYIGFTVDIF